AAALQPQLAGPRLHRVDDELDVLGQVHAEFGGAALDVLALDVAGEAFRLHLLLDAGGGQVGDAVGPHQGRRGDEAGQFVAGVKGFVHQLRPRAVGEVVGVRLDRV